MRYQTMILNLELVKEYMRSYGTSRGLHHIYNIDWNHCTCCTQISMAKQLAEKWDSHD